MRPDFRITVAAIIEQDGRYLMVEETVQGRQCYNQPAGHVEGNEDLVTAVRREVREETCREFTPDSLVGIYRWQMPGTDRIYLRFCFRGSVSDPILGCELDPDITATHWLSREEIIAERSQLRSPLVLASLEDAAQGVAAPLSMLRGVV